MAQILTRLTSEEIARQIAVLLNSHNELKGRHSAYTVLASPATYFVELCEGQVVGCSAILQEDSMLTRQFHLCTHPDFRRRGIAGRLKQTGIERAKTPYVYVTVRDNNIPSLRIQEKFGFVFVRKDPSRQGNYWVYTLARATRPNQLRRNHG